MSCLSDKMSWMWNRPNPEEPLESLDSGPVSVENWIPWLLHRRVNGSLMCRKDPLS